MDETTRQRLGHLRAYLRLLSESGLLTPDDATCVLYARLDDDRRALADDPGEALVTQLLALASHATEPRKLDAVLVTPEASPAGPVFRYRCAYCAHEATGIAPSWAPAIIANALHRCTGPRRG